MKTDFSVLSSDGIHTLKGIIYQPTGTPEGYFHIVHGMTEHIARYDRIMTDLANAGFICFGYDHLGHGYTATDDSELGFIASKGGDDLLCRDVKVFSEAVMTQYGQLPYYLMGHSMGSFITRLAVEKYVTPDKYIIMGTGGKNPLAGMGLAVIALIKACKRERYISDLVQNLAFGSYNKRFGGGTPSDPDPWLTRDEKVRRRYYADPFCTFRFTVSAMGDLIRLNKNSNRKAWYKNMPKDLPILLLSGSEDPVGDYGNGVTQVCEDLQKTGHNVRAILYPDARHEILNDSTYDQVRKDILGFLAD